MPWAGLDSYSEAPSVYGSELRLPDGATFKYNEPKDGASVNHGRWTFQRRFMGALPTSEFSEYWTRAVLYAWTNDVSGSMGALTVRRYHRHIPSHYEYANIRTYTGLLTLRCIQAAHEYDRQVLQVEKLLGTEEYHKYLARAVASNLPHVHHDVLALPVLKKLLRNKVESTRINETSGVVTAGENIRGNLSAAELISSMLYTDEDVDKVFQSLMVAGRGDSI